MSDTTTSTPKKTRLPGPIGSGRHDNFGQGHCAMELADYLDRRRQKRRVPKTDRLTDRPKCVSNVIGAFVRDWNDSLPDDDTRTRLLGTIVPQLLDTATCGADEEERARMATDWLARVCAPAWLDLAGLTDHSAALRAMAPIVSDASARDASVTLSAAYSAADAAARSAARSAACSAADAAARSAACSAAYSAAYSAARSAARSAAYSAADAAADAAARSAACSAAYSAAYSAADAAADAAAYSAAYLALAPTVAALQASAVDLVIRMCNVGRRVVSP